MLGGWEIRRGKIWRIAAIFAVAGVLAVSGCASGIRFGRIRIEPTARAGREGRRDREHRARGHQVVRQAGRRSQHSVHAQRVQGSKRQDRRLRRRPDERDRGDARLDRGVSRIGLRQDHPVDPGWNLQRRDVVVHRHQGAGADPSTSSRTSRRASCGRSGRASRSTRTMPAGRRLRSRPPRPRKPRSCLPRARRAPTRASRRSTS